MLLSTCRYILLTPPFIINTGLSPPPEVHISGPKFVERGHPIRLTCNATGSIRPPEEIDWFHEGRKIKTNSMEEIFITKYMRHETNTLKSVLVIRHSDQIDSGTYICRSSDDKITSHQLLVLNGRSCKQKSIHYFDRMDPHSTTPLPHLQNNMFLFHATLYKI